MNWTLITILSTHSTACRGSSGLVFAMTKRKDGIHVKLQACVEKLLRKILNDIQYSCFGGADSEADDAAGADVVASTND